MVKTKIEIGLKSGFRVFFINYLTFLVCLKEQSLQICEAGRLVAGDIRHMEKSSDTQVVVAFWFAQEKANPDMFLRLSVYFYQLCYNELDLH